jgi:hypothetical protein
MGERFEGAVCRKTESGKQPDFLAAQNDKRSAGLLRSVSTRLSIFYAKTQ